MWNTIQSALQIRNKMTPFYLLHLAANQRILFLPFPLFYATSAKNEIGLVLLSDIISLLQAAGVPLFDLKILHIRCALVQGHEMLYNG